MLIAFIIEVPSLSCGLELTFYVDAL
jgi:hypothetical protein